MKLGRLMLVGLALLVGTSFAIPDDASARPRYGGWYGSGHHHHQHYRGGYGHRHHHHGHYRNYPRSYGYYPRSYGSYYGYPSRSYSNYYSTPGWYY
jgi:hypothetical protein